MSWSFPEVRRLVAKLGDPEIEQSELGMQLKDTLGTDSARDAVLHVIHKTFDGSSPRNRLSRDVILKPAFEGDRGMQAASTLDVSLRTFFRRRKEAMKKVASAIERTLNAANPRLAFKLETARMIAEVRPLSVMDIVERESRSAGGMAAYQAVLISLRGGFVPPSDMLDRCRGHWRLLAELEMARCNASGKDPAAYESTRSAVRASLKEFRGAARERVEFELAYADRLDALRKCDVDMSAEATTALTRTSGPDVRLRALAAICRAEQACDEGRLAAAGALVRDLQALSVRLNDFRVAGRTSHVASIVNLLEGNYVDAADCSRFAFGALAHIEPEFSPCTAAIEGRAQFFLDKRWECPSAIVRRFPDSYETAFLKTVHARYLVLSDPHAALTLADRSALVSQSQQARGALLYAEATRSIVFECLSRVEEAQAERVRAWSNGVRLRRPFYLFDFLIHPALPARAFGAFAFDDAFLTAIEARFDDLLGASESREAGSEAAKGMAVQCLSAAAPLARRCRAGQSSVMHRAAKRETGRVYRALQRLAVDLAYCLPVDDRAVFMKGFDRAASDILGVSKSSSTKEEFHDSTLAHRLDSRNLFSLVRADDRKRAPDDAHRQDGSQRQADEHQVRRARGL